ncbi:MAG: segregation/condensation protein A [Oscillospiraceae bacterium]|jgi:segregation and condensation protein A|nr:segregation/condensation protein A [Oscillospiraceae bacterium]
MAEFSFKTEVYEGPLDLMLTLISKHKLSITDIKISVLLEQFLLYLDAMREADIEIAGEFLEMAARLIYMKSAALLPKHELEELKKELQHSLEEYALYKKAAARLAELYKGADIFTREPEELPVDNEYRGLHETDELINALASVLGRDRLSSMPLPVMPAMLQKYVSVFSKIVFILKQIRHGGKFRLEEFYKGQSRSDRVAVFLALLELSAHGRVKFSDDGEIVEVISK